MSGNLRNLILGDVQLGRSGSGVVEPVFFRIHFASNLTVKEP